MRNILPAHKERLFIPFRFYQKKSEVLTEANIVKRNANENEKSLLIKKWLSTYKLSVFPESATGVNYLLKTSRLTNGSYATLDIGAGTSEIAIFEVKNNELEKYYCSESTELASNDFYREYAKQHYERKNHQLFNLETFSVKVF